MSKQNPFPKKRQAETYKFHHEFQPDDSGNFPLSVVCKFDYFTAMYYDCKVLDLLKFFNLDMYLTDDLFECYNKRDYLNNSAGKFLKILLAPGISVELPVQSIWTALKLSEAYDIAFDQFCNTVFPSIRLALTGTGLEYLRSENYDVEKRFMLPSYLVGVDGKFYANAPDGTRCKITRLDVAFDFLNYDVDLYKLMCELCDKYESSPGNIFCGLDIKKCRSSKWTAKVGGERTLYLGSTASKKLVRVYDKLFQFQQGKDSLAKFPYKTVDGVIPDSWIRLELQLKYDECDDILFTCAGDFSKMLNWFYYHFALCKAKNEVIPEFESFFNWDLISSIIQNANYGKVLPTVEEKIASIISRIAKGYSTLVSLCESTTAATDLIESYFVEMQRSPDDIDKRRFASYRRAALLPDNTLGAGWYLNKMGYYQFVR